MVFEFKLAIDYRDHWLGIPSYILPVDLHLIDVTLLNDKSVQCLVDVDLKDTSPDILRETLNDIEIVEFVRNTDVLNGRMIMIVGVKSCVICSSIIESGSYIKAATSYGGEVSWSIISPDKRSVQSIIQSLEKDGIGYELMKIKKLENKDILSKKQEKLLKKAYDGGYFDCPKKMKTNDIAEEGNISAAAASESLRRALKKVIQYHFSNYRY